MKWHDRDVPIRVGVSACLLGAEVRFDGGHKRDRYVTDVLGEHVEWVPVCPEIEAGLGIPRPVIQLREGSETERFVLRESGEDLTAMMRGYSAGRAEELETTGLDGFVLKKDSPSCGKERVRVYKEQGGMPHRRGVGLFTQALKQVLPDLPLEEEGRLNDLPLREKFIEAIFSHNRWRVLERRGLNRRALIGFHQAHKMLLLAHDPTIYGELGRLVASFGRRPDQEIYDAYRPLFLAAFRKPATVARHVNAIEHLFGHLKTKLTVVEKREVACAIADYRAGCVPLVVPITLLRFLVAAHGVEYVQEQIYLEPHPKEWMLRNHV